MPEGTERLSVHYSVLFHSRISSRYVIAKSVPVKIRRSRQIAFQFSYLVTTDV